MSTLFQFPGQGAQRPDMLHALPDDAEIRRTLAEAAEVLDTDPLSLDSAQTLEHTRAVQLCLLIAGVATARLLLSRGPVPQLVAGLSIGAYAAAVVADALDFADSLRLVARRGELMQAAYPSGYGMLAILGLGRGAVEKLVSDHQRPDAPLYLANANAEQQYVVAGSDAGLAVLAEAARTGGSQAPGHERAVPLPAAGGGRCDPGRGVRRRRAARAATGLSERYFGTAAGARRTAARRPCLQHGAAHRMARHPGSRPRARRAPGH